MKPFGILLAVKDMERSLQFYKEVFGYKVITDFGANKGLDGGIALQTADSWQEFISKESSEISYKSNAYELYVEADDFDAFITKLKSIESIEYVHPLIEHRWGQHVIRFYDPDGHIIEVGENMDIVVKRFIDSGLSAEETATRMDVPLDYIYESLNRTT